jgi:hypothetical protein
VLGAGLRPGPALSSAAINLGILVMPDRQAALAALREELARAVEDLTGILGPDAARAFDDEGTGTQDPETGTDLDSATARAIEVFAAYKRTGRRELLDRSVALFRTILAAPPRTTPTAPGI